MCWWLGLIATGVDAANQNQAGKEAEAAGKRDALVGELQAQDALARGGIEEQRYRRQVAQIAGMQKTQIGARNVARSGTALDILTDTATIGEEDVLTLRNESAREAWGYRTRADESRRWGATQRRNANGRATATLVSGGAQAYGQWADAYGTRRRRKSEETEEDE
jgi:hypothetical protein